ncbi:MAG: RNA-binding domain-containing protein [Thermoplasmatota archaeon]
MQKRYHFLRITAMVHATEDESKVLRSMEILIGGGLPVEIERREAEGIFHNPITYMVLELTGQKQIFSIVEKWESEEFWQLSKEHLEERMDEDLVYHVRVDKQKACLGELELWSKGEAIEIQLKPATYPSSREKAKAIIFKGPPR